MAPPVQACDGPAGPGFTLMRRASRLVIPSVVDCRSASWVGLLGFARIYGGRDGTPLPGSPPEGVIVALPPGSAGVPADPRARADDLAGRSSRCEDVPSIPKEPSVQLPPLHPV